MRELNFSANSNNEEPKTNENKVQKAKRYMNDEII